jgi:hypothetical protein
MWTTCHGEATEECRSIVEFRKPSTVETNKAMNQHIIRTLGYTGIFVIFVAAAGYFIWSLPNEDQQKVRMIR